MNFIERSYQKELLDQEGIPFDAIKQNMRELDVINTWLGGHGITLDGFKQLLQGRKRISVCEIGCGGGDNLFAIAAWCDKHNVEVKLTGIDINADCMAVARERLQHYEPQLITSDFRKADFGDHHPDIIFSSLFCHHFTNEELVDMLQWMRSHARTGFFYQRPPPALPGLPLNKNIDTAFLKVLSCQK